MYKDGDLHYSPVNRVLDAQTKMTAWAPTNLLANGLYAWRARRIDADGRPGPWSDGRLFRLGRIPTRTAVTVSKDGGKLRVKGTLKPPRPGRTMAVSLYRMRSGSFSKLTTKSPTIGSSGGFSTAFGRPAPGSCRVVARYPGDSSYLPSSAAASFRC